MIDLLKDMHSAESQIVKALEKMVQKASSQKLKDAFDQHLKESREHVKRVEEACKIVDVKPTGEKCLGIEGIINESELMIASVQDEDVLDATLIVSAQRVEHYEIASYGTAITLAKMLEDSRVAELLGQNLDNEKKTDSKLTELAESMINEKAL